MSGLLGTLVTIATPKRAIKESAEARAYNVPLIVDSGAWSNFTGSANITLADHIAWVQTNWQPGARHVALDVIGNSEDTYRNWFAERQTGLAVEPTIHFGDAPTDVDKYLSDGLGSDWINLGGMAHLQKNRSLHRQLAAWCAAVMVRCPSHIRFHGLGATTPELNDLVPFDAVDSTYWLDIYKFGKMRLFDSDRGRFYAFSVSGRRANWLEGERQKIGSYGKFLRDQYDTSARELLDMTEEEHVSLTILGHKRFSEYYARRHGSDLTTHLAGTDVRHFPHMNHLNTRSK